MKYYLIILFLTWITPLTSLGQLVSPFTLKGKVIESASSAPMINATVTILNAKDSILINYTRVQPEGTFLTENIHPGRYIIMIGYPGYADYVQNISIGMSATTYDLGIVRMVLKAKLLEEVLIKGTASKIVLRGDTTEYNAASFRIEPNSRVEDLLRQLPGIQIDANGKITAQGKIVNTVLVDGEEFFGDDPTLVTRNIRGDMVDKVQLYDKKSDRAILTGIDDGSQKKTINIKLRSDKKNGYFGKLDAAGGNNDYYQTQAMFNYFKGDMKFSAYGNLANTGKSGLTANDNRKYGIGTEPLDNGAIIIKGLGMEDLDSNNGRYNGEGNPNVRSSGAHFNTKWDEGKQSLNTDFKVGAIDINGNRESLVQNNLSDGIINSTTNQQFDNQMTRTKLNAMYGASLNPAMDLKIAIEGTLKNVLNNTQYDAFTIGSNDLLLNKSSRNLNNDGTQQLVHLYSSLNKRFKKNGRYINLDLRQTFNENRIHGLLNAENRFFNVNGLLDSIQNINQYKTNLVRSSLFNSKIEFSEPISKSFFLLLEYSLMINNSVADRKTFHRDSNNDWSLVVQVLSNNYKFDQISNQFGTLIAYVNGKSHINIGTKLSRINFRQTNINDNSNFLRDFFYWNPQATYRYKVSPQKSFRLNYTGYTVQPTLDQIQPILINTDPLNITLGNPELRPSFSNSFNFSYDSFKILNDQSVFINGTYIINSNPIVNQISTDVTGKSTYQYLNLPDQTTTSFNMNASWSQTVKKTDLEVGADLGMNSNLYFNIINNTLNRTSWTSYTGKLKLSRIKKKNEVLFNMGPQYVRSVSSLQKDVNNNGWGLNSNLSLLIKLPGKTQISTNADYTFREKTAAFNQNFSRFILNGKISRKFLKNENLICSFSGNDILNQNIGFTRNAFNNMLFQDSYTTIKRYFMFSAVFDFNKMGGTKSKK